MFQGAFRVRSRGTANSKGFSLTEFAFSILLIAAIAVLSFPTVQGFTPVSGLQERASQSLPVSPKLAPAESGNPQVAPKGLMARPNTELGNGRVPDSSATDNQGDAEQGGNAK
jgi:hypothetical protein